MLLGAFMALSLVSSNAPLPFLRTSLCCQQGQEIESLFLNGSRLEFDKERNSDTTGLLGRHQGHCSFLGPVGKVAGAEGRLGATCFANLREAVGPQGILSTKEASPWDFKNHSLQRLRLRGLGAGSLTFVVDFVIFSYYIRPKSFMKPFTPEMLRVASASVTEACKL